MMNKVFTPSIKTSFKFLVIALFSFILSCQDFTEVEPPNSKVGSAYVFNNATVAESAVIGIYHSMLQKPGFTGYISNISSLAGLSGDELDDTSITPNARTEFYLNDINIQNQENLNLWSTAYNLIYSSNVIIEGLTASTAIPADVRSRLIAESKFVRAFCYFYLMNFYGEVPYLRTSDYKANMAASRTAWPQAYEWITQDLIEAVNTLPDDYTSYSGERVRPTAMAATALLARVYLFAGDWANAESYATTVIENNLFALSANLNEVFLKNSAEAIWQLMPVDPRYNTYDGSAFILTSTPPFFAMSETLANAFESGDARRSAWVGTYSNATSTFYFAHKYKVATLNAPVTEYLMVLRLAEQYLIRAEARTRQNKISTGVQDLNVLRGRANLPLLAEDINQQTALGAVMKERQIELFTEWGHRWLDLKRTNETSGLATIKAGFTANDFLYPIPELEILRNGNLGPQNPGY